MELGTVETLALGVTGGVLGGVKVETLKGYNSGMEGGREVGFVLLLFL